MSVRLSGSLVSAALVCSTTIGCHGVDDISGEEGEYRALPSSGSVVRLVSVSANKCVDLENGSSADGANIRLWPCNGLDAQDFVLDPAPDGYVLLRNVASNKCVDVSGWSQSPGANIFQWSCHGGANQQWALEETASGIAVIRSRHSGLVLDIEGNSTANGANILQWNAHGGNNQKFELVVDGGGDGGDGGDDGGGDGGGDPTCDIAVFDPGDPPQTLTLTGNLGTHDPTLIEQNGTFYLQQTGPRIYGKVSSNLFHWQGTPSALGGSNPPWVAQEVPGATDLWAPDLSYFGGQYHLYYSASTFGSNHSCIGHATRTSMASGSWADQGPVVCSSGGNNYNAIDPNVIVDENGTPWMSFGSFWSGIKMIQLDQTGARANNDLHSLASRGGGAIEAPVIVRRCGYYYLFVSFDSCCQGASSTYNIRVGRSTNVLGPYVDQSGVPMMNGGGTVLVQGNDTWRGPGHNAVIFVGDEAYNVYHAYRADNGAPELRVSELAWNGDQWPVSAGP